MISSKSKTSNVLWTLGILFTIGGAARLLPETPAWGESPKTAEQETRAIPIKASTAVSPMSAAETDEVCFTGETAIQLDDELRLVEASKSALRAEQLQLAEWEAELEAQAAELDSLRSVLDARWETLQTASDADLKHLSQMYGSMKPDQAAQIFNRMDPSFAAGFLRMINSDQAGLIMANMDAEKAYIVSVELANINADLRAIR